MPTEFMGVKPSFDVMAPGLPKAPHIQPTV